MVTIIKMAITMLLMEEMIITMQEMAIIIIEVMIKTIVLTLIMIQIIITHGEGQNIDYNLHIYNNQSINNTKYDLYQILFIWVTHRYINLHSAPSSCQSKHSTFLIYQVHIQNGMKHMNHHKKNI